MTQPHDERSPAELAANNDELLQSLARCREMLAACRAKLDAISGDTPPTGITAAND